MKRTLTLGFILTLVSLGCYAQDSYYFEYQEKEQTELNFPSTKRHFLGDEIARKMQLLKQSYTYQTETMMTNVLNTSIEKPSIYYSVSKINKYLKKEVKKGGISENDAKSIMENVLNIALNIRYQDTQDFEKELWDIKDPSEITDLYSNRVELGQ